MAYQSEAELEERLMAKLETQGYEIVKLKDYDALVDNFRAQLNRFNKETLGHDLTDAEFKRGRMLRQEGSYVDHTNLCPNHISADGSFIFGHAAGVLCAQKKEP